MAIRKSTTNADKKSKKKGWSKQPHHQYIRHPVQNYRRIKAVSTTKVNERKKKIEDGKDFNGYQVQQNKMLLVVVTIFAGVLVLLELLGKFL